MVRINKYIADLAGGKWGAGCGEKWIKIEKRRLVLAVCYGFVYKCIHFGFIA